MISIVFGSSVFVVITFPRAFWESEASCSAKARNGSVLGHLSEIKGDWRPSTCSTFRPFVIFARAESLKQEISPHFNHKNVKSRKSPTGSSIFLRDLLSVRSCEAALVGDQNRTCCDQTRLRRRRDLLSLLPKIAQMPTLRPGASDPHCATPGKRGTS